LKSDIGQAIEEQEALNGAYHAPLFFSLLSLILLLGTKFFAVTPVVKSLKFVNLIS